MKASDEFKAERAEPRKHPAAWVKSCISLTLACVVSTWLAAAPRFPARYMDQAESKPVDFQFGVRVELVNVFVTVLNRRGNLVTGLGKDDFIVYENGTPQSISQFSHEYVPLSVIILLDASSSMRGKKLENAKKALVQFLKRLRPGDEAMLVTFRTHSEVRQQFTQDLDKLTSQLKRLEGIGSTALYDAILSALDFSNSALNRRRALLLISDGLNTYGKAKIEETIARLRRVDLELFAIGLESSLPEDMQDQAITRYVLDVLARSAGGEVFPVGDSKQLPAVCSTIADRMHNQYSFAYYPSKGKDNDWRTIRVETRTPGLRVIASKAGYYPFLAPERRPE